MEKLKTISIIIPIYKVEEYIERCIRSIMLQTFHNCHIECILVDDCSPDASIEKARSVVSGYQGDIEFIFTKTSVNSGISAARNKGLAVASGDYVFFIDSDDDLAPHVLELFVEKMVRNPNVGVVIGNNEQNGIPSFLPAQLPEYIFSKKKILELFYRGYLPVTAWNVMINRNIISKNQLIFKEGIVHEDILWTFRLFEVIDSLAIISEVTYHYEINPQSTVNVKDKDYTPYVNSLLLIINEIYEHFHKELYVDNMLYIVTFMILLIENMHKYHSSEEQFVEVFAMRRRIHRKMLKDGRLLLFLFGALMYSPYSNVFSFHIFRANYNMIRNVVRIISKIFHC